jgi:hypothetical protein
MNKIGNEALNVASEVMINESIILFKAILLEPCGVLVYGLGVQLITFLGGRMYVW